VSWNNYKFYADEIEARQKVALLQKMAEADDAAQAVKLPEGGYMVQLNERHWDAFNRHANVSGKQNYPPNLPRVPNPVDEDGEPL
jgi:hypothetical protein